MTDNEIKQIDVAKYEEALNNLIGVDNAYFKGDKDVDTLVECIILVKQFSETIKRQQAEIERLKGDFADFGKTVFLTREEAEKALKGDVE